MAEPVNEILKEPGGLKAKDDEGSSVEAASQEVPIISDVCEMQDSTSLGNGDKAQKPEPSSKEVMEPWSDSAANEYDTDHSLCPGDTEGNVNIPSNEGSSMPSVSEGKEGSSLCEEAISEAGLYVRSVGDDAAQELLDTHTAAQLNPSDCGLPGVLVEDHFGNTDDDHRNCARSPSVGSSDSEGEQRMVGLGEDNKEMELTQIDSDTGSSSVSPRDRAGSEMSSEDPSADLEVLRQCAGSVVSNVSSYSWMREGTMGSMVSLDPDSALGRIRADMAALVSGDGAGDAVSGQFQAGEDSDMGQSTELTNELEAGPTVTLPPSEPPTLNPAADASLVSAPTVSSPACVTAEGFNAGQAQPEVNRNSSGLDQRLQQSESDATHDHSASQGAHSAAAAEPAVIPAQSKPSTSAEAATPASPAKPRIKKTPNDFIFGKVIGEGSYSTVYLAKEVSSQKEFAIKICEKKHLIRERKTHFVMREKEVFMKLDHPFFVKLAYTFQDSERLYYVLTYARNGELLSYLHKLSVFDVPCTRFYTAEVVVALEYLHNLGIIHRDLKPENILLSEDMHIKITDFGTSKVLQLDENGKPITPTETKRKNSFVGTAEYVSPEVLNNEPANFGSDLWALGCIIYQCLSGSMPFRAGNEYQTFQKIVKADYTFPEGFDGHPQDIVLKLLVLDPEQRLGMPKTGGMPALKAHKFYDGINWEDLPNTTPPKFMPYLPATSHNPEFWGQDHRVGFDDQRLAEIITGQSNADGSLSPELEEVPMRGASPIDGVDEAAACREERLEKQRRENQFHQYVQGNLILKQGFVDKRKGLFARKRMLLLTEGPHLYYVDAHHKVLKGEIPWSKYLRPEAKNFKIFFVHTPNRTYYLESRLPDAQMWVKKIKEVWKKYYGSTLEEKS